MPNGWVCEGCGQFFRAVDDASKIVVSMKPRRYRHELTFCSLRCLDSKRDEIQEDEVLAVEYAR